MILGCLFGATLRKNSHYLERGTWLPLRPPETPTREDCFFTEILQVEKKTGGTIGEMQCMYLGRNMEARQNENLRALGNHAIPVIPPPPVVLNQGNYSGGLTSTGGDRRIGH